MAQDEVSLYNLALSTAGSRSRISAPTEASREAEICRLWFAPIARQILRAAPWASVRAFDNLAVVKERADASWVDGDPNPEYRFAYALPAQCLRPRFLRNYARFEVALLSSNVQALMTNSEQALLYYTYDQQQISMWDPDLYLAVAYGVAAAIAQPLSGKPGLTRTAQQMANAIILSAREASANESYEPLEALSPSLQARGAIAMPIQPYVYPNGPVLAITNV